MVPLEHAKTVLRALEKMCDQGGEYRAARAPRGNHVAADSAGRALRGALLALSTLGWTMPQNGRALLQRVGDLPLGARRACQVPSQREQGQEFMRVAALVCAVLSAGSAHAASISIESTGPDPVVVVQGSFEGKDGEQFFTKTGSLSAAIIRLESNGGSLVAGIQIGETIRLKGFQTLVPAGARCASACAMAWLGGTQRFMGPNARIGLHLVH